MGLPIEPESPQVRRAREKLTKQLGKQDAQITEEALKKTTDKMSSWIAAHAVNRVSLPQKGLGMFDGNKHPAPVSDRVDCFFKSLIGSS